jgi:hypothetical protein
VVHVSRQASAAENVLCDRAPWWWEDEAERSDARPLVGTLSGETPSRSLRSASPRSGTWMDHPAGGIYRGARAEAKPRTCCVIGALRWLFTLYTP